MAKLANTRRVSIWANGVLIPTTIGELRKRSQSNTIAQLLTDFETAREMARLQNQPIPISFATTYRDYNYDPHNLQIDLIS